MQREAHMFTRLLACAVVAQACLALPARAEETSAPPSFARPDADGFITLFNGRDLTGWMGLPDYWSVRDGAISGHQTKDGSRQTFLVLSGIRVRDFELHFSYRFASPEGNSGLQFRSKVLDPDVYRVGGYQADFDAEGRFDGSIYDEAGVAGNRETLSRRGERTVWDGESKRHSEPLVADGDLGSLIRRGGWNESVLLVKGNLILYRVNGHVMTDLIDESPTALHEGILALQLHQGFTMDVRFKDLSIKLLQP
jgi:hypothetical protein